MSHDIPVESTGLCWCGCGTKVGFGRFFAQGHDKKAEGALLDVAYDGSVAALLAAHGFDSGTSVVAAAVERGSWRRCPERGCSHAGSVESMQNHLKRKHGKGK